jgi:hypothetical protein
MTSCDSLPHHACRIQSAHHHLHTADCTRPIAQQQWDPTNWSSTAVSCQLCIASCWAPSNWPETALVTVWGWSKGKQELEGLVILCRLTRKGPGAGRDQEREVCYNLFLRRPDKAGAKIDNNCGRASLDREHVGSLSLNQWVKGKQVKRCIRLEVCKLTRRAWRIPCKVASWEALYCNWMKEIIWSLGKRINESEMCVLIYLFQRPSCAVFATWYHGVPYNAIWFHMVKASAIWCHMVLYGECRCHMVEAGVVWCHTVPCGESRCHMVECGMFEMWVTIPDSLRCVGL